MGWPDEPFRGFPVAKIKAIKRVSTMMISIKKSDTCAKIN